MEIVEYFVMVDIFKKIYCLFSNIENELLVDFFWGVES